jgi:hypothetical protein
VRLSARQNGSDLGLDLLSRPSGLSPGEAVLDLCELAIRLCRGLGKAPRVLAVQAHRVTANKAASACEDDLVPSSATRPGVTSVDDAERPLEPRGTQSDESGSDPRRIPTTASLSPGSHTAWSSRPSRLRIRRTIASDEA